MSVLKSVIDVNNGNAGWTKQNLMDAFETALGNLGYHTGVSQVTDTLTGVPQFVMAPDGGTTTYGGVLSELVQANGNDGGETHMGTYKIQKYRVTDLTTSSAISMTTNSGDGSNYTITGTDRQFGHNSSTDPGITLYLGDTITFDNSALGGSHPMYIRVSDGGASVSNPAATGEGTDTVSWTPNAAGTYYYQCGVAGHTGMIGTITVLTIATDSYRITKYLDGQRMDYSLSSDTATDEFKFDRHGFSTGDRVRYAPGKTDVEYNLGTTVIANTLYFVIKTSRDRFKLATSLANAQGGTHIVLDGYTTNSSTWESFRQEDAAYAGGPAGANNYVNPTIDLYQGDWIQFENDAGNATNLTLCQDVDAFDTNQRIVHNDSTYGSTPNSPIRGTKNISSNNAISYRNNTTNISCAAGSSLTWDTDGYMQSESEPFYPTSLTNPSFATIPGADGTKKYIYCSETNAVAKGVINLLASSVTTNYASQIHNYPYWKYTVPAAAGRSELKLRVHRYGNTTGQLRNITIHSIGTGWSDDEVFTIPGELVGGTATTGDIRFGVPTPETSSNAYDGIAGIKTTTLGGGSNFYQKNDTGAFAVLYVENDASKKYGYTFYSFYLEGTASTAWTFKIQCGNGWDFLNCKGTSSTSLTNTSEWGDFTGYMGVDRQNVTIQTSVDSFTVSTASTPTAYPMQIRTFRAQAPQDTNFAVIQFTQTINEKTEPYATFNLHVGDGYGNGVFDLDEVFLGGTTEYQTNITQGIRIMTEMPCYYSGHASYYSAANEPMTAYSQAKNAYYGYLRGGSYGNYQPHSTYDDYYNNISQGVANQRSIYYRNNTYDKHLNIAVDSAADYYKPIKTIPISTMMIPCPYYLPDDFVLLQVVATPGLTEFRPGDTVTVSGSEIYEVIQASYQAQQTGLDGLSNNSSEGMLFLARTT